MDIKITASGITLILVGVTTISALALHSGFQANKISSLQASISQQQATIAALEDRSPIDECEPTAAGYSQPSLLSITPINHELDTTESLDQPRAEPTITNSNDNKDEYAEPAEEEDITGEDVRAFLSDFIKDSDLSNYSDAELFTEGAQLLEDTIQDQDQDFDASITAAYALQEITGDAVPEHLAHSIIQKAYLSDNEQDLREVIYFIADQDYTNTTLLAPELINSDDPDARMVGIYLLATNSDTASAAPDLANQIYAYPEDTLQLLNQLLGE